MGAVYKQLSITERRRIERWRYAPDPNAVEGLGDDAQCFLPVEIVDPPRNEKLASTSDPVPVQNAIEVDIAGGHRLRIIGGYPGMKSDGDQKMAA